MTSEVWRVNKRVLNFNDTIFSLYLMIISTVMKFYTGAFEWRKSRSRWETMLLFKLSKSHKSGA